MVRFSQRTYTPLAVCVGVFLDIVKVTLVLNMSAEYGFKSYEKAPTTPSPKEVLHDEGERKARRIAREKVVTEAMQELKHEGLLHKNVEKTKLAYAETFKDTEFLTPRDWEMLTTVRLYCPELSDHSVETYSLVKAKLDHIHIKEETLATLITTEGASLDQFYRACVLHDIGKTTIPESVLNFALEPGDWLALKSTLEDKSRNEKILEHLGIPPDSEIDAGAIFTLLTDTEMNPVTSIPASAILTEEQVLELEQRGISSRSTLRQILELHEPASERILADEGLPVEAGIVGQHHNYRKDPYKYPFGSQTIGITADLADILRLADGEQAMLSERSYKPAFTRITTYDLLVKDALRGAINKHLTALWIEQELKEDTPSPANEVEFKKLEQVLTFISEYGELKA